MLIPEVPEELVEEFSNGNGIVFVGAGLSIGAGLPSWAALMEPLAREVRDLPPGSTYLEIAQYYENQEDRGRLQRKLVEALDAHQVSPTEVHKIVTSLPVRRIFTTNFDDLLERALTEKKIPYSVTVVAEDIALVDSIRMEVIKLHGNLRQADSMVITSEDYESFFDTHPDLASSLAEVLKSKTVLFLGYSFKDPDFRMLLRQVRRQIGRFTRNQYAVQFTPSPVEIRDLEQRGVKVINLQFEPGSNEANHALEAWLNNFANRINERRGAGGKEKEGDDQTPNTALLPHPSKISDLPGREDQYHRIILDLASPLRLITIEGFAGVGKTSLATVVGHACLNNGSAAISQKAIFRYVVWISANDKLEQKQWFNDVLDAIAIQTGSPATARLHPDKINQKKNEVADILRNNRTLVIVDNFETIDDPDLKAWLQNIPGSSKVIVTTRELNTFQNLGSRLVHLKGLPEAQALTLIRQYAGQRGLEYIEKADDLTLKPLWEATGGNPQVIIFAIGRIRAGVASMKQVIDQLSGIESMDEKFKSLFYGSWESLHDTGRRVLLVTPLFVGTGSIRREALAAVSGLGTYEFNEGLERCVAFSFLEQQLMDEQHQGQFVIHPMTRAFAREQLNELPEFEAAARRNCSQYFLKLLRDTIVRTNQTTGRTKPEPRYWNTLVSDRMDKIDTEWPSIHEVMGWAARAGEDQILTDFVMLLVHYMDSRLYNTERLEYVNKAVEALQRLDRPEDESLLRIDALGWTYVEEDELEEADRQITEGLRIAERHARQEKNDLLALGRAWQARVRIEQDHPEEASALIDQALALLGDCNDWIKFRVNFAAGDIALKQGHSENALAKYLLAKEEMERYGGEGHNYQIDPRIGLAMLEVGDLDNALLTFEKLRAYEKIEIGKLYAEYGLALVEYRRGNEVDARSRIAEIQERLKRRTQSNLLLKLINASFAAHESEQGMATEQKIVVLSPSASALYQIHKPGSE